MLKDLSLADILYSSFSAKGNFNLVGVSVFQVFLFVCNVLIFQVPPYFRNNCSKSIMEAVKKRRKTHAKSTIKIPKLHLHNTAGAQPNIFQGRGGFVKLGSFDIGVFSPRYP